MIRLLVTLAFACGLCGPAFAITVQEVKSPGGLKAYVSEDHTSPVIAVSFAFLGGSALDPKEKAGLSDMASSLLDEGAGALDSFAFQSELEDRAITLRYEVDRDRVTGSVTTTTASSAKAFELLKLSLTQPRFDGEPVERIRRQMLVGIAQNSESPNYLARQKIYEALFGEHPYARGSDGRPETVQAITADDLKAWVKTRFARDRLQIAVSGDITPAEVGKMMDAVFGGLPAATKLDPKLAAAEIKTRGQVVRIPKNLPQSVIYLGQRGIKRADPDWYAATLVDYSFGGGSFASRLMEEVREKRGLAYGVSTMLVPMDAGAAVFCSVATRADQADNSLAIIRAEWKKMHDGGPTETELSAAKQYLTGAWPLRFTSTGNIAAMLLAVQRDNLGLDYIDKRNSLIEAVTLEQVKRVARALYDPEGLDVVIVGPDPKAAAKPK